MDVLIYTCSPSGCGTVPASSRRGPGARQCVSSGKQVSCPPPGQAPLTPSFTSSPDPRPSQAALVLLLGLPALSFQPKLHYTCIRQCLIDLSSVPPKLRKGKIVAGLLPCCPCRPALTELVLMGRLSSGAFIHLTATSSVHPRGSQKWDTAATPTCLPSRLPQCHTSVVSLQG